MKAVTWQKDSHGLFDYETKSLSVKKYKIDCACKIYRAGILFNNIFNIQEQIILLIDSNQTVNETSNQKFLTSISKGPDQNSYLINPTNQEESENFLIVRSLKNQQGIQKVLLFIYIITIFKGYKLQPGDVLKLGRIEYAVIEIRDDQGSVNSVKNIFAKELYLIQPTEHKNQATCRICLSDQIDDEINNPLITPCKCKGTCQYVHFTCLKTWIESRSQKKENGNTAVYKWKRLDCEVCNEPLPKKLVINQLELNLADIERPDTPYLLLESIIKDKKASRGFYIIKGPITDAVKMGRGHQCDIRISDISVSRLHAEIKYENGSFLIVDNNSKFGTLVKMHKPFLIQNEKIAIQIGRTVLTFTMKIQQQFLSDIPLKKLTLGLQLPQNCQGQG